MPHDRHQRASERGDTVTAAPAGPDLDLGRELVANQLWKTLNHARANPSLPKTLTDVEDAVFRFYLPFAHAVAEGHPAAAAHSAVMEQAAEVGLAQAVLAWRYRDSRDFQRFAGLRIQAQLRVAVHRRRRPIQQASGRP